MLVACGGLGGGREDDGSASIGTFPTGPGTNSVGSDGTDGTADGTADGTSSADGTGNDDATKFDLGIPPDAPPPSEEGCTKVDFLFIIDNSGSMDDEQANLVNSFPGFINGIQSTLSQVDEYQVGVVTTDAYSPNNNVPGCNVLGGLVTKTGGSNSSNSVCGPYVAGNNYMTELDNLGTSFACAAQVGTDGNGIERPMDALVSVVNKVNGGPGQCNEGFLRDDALLVLVIITDEWDGPNDPEFPGSSGTPQNWYDAVVAAKLGIPENAVAVALINWQGSATCPPSDSFYDGVHIRDFVNLFGANGFLGGVCEPDYGPIFSQA
ncbi:MAG: hypothetical protein KDK70_27990, partial [Myxococcales bacterium]|nr:hypothetical protein [Myxococcales bacterium]